MQDYQVVKALYYSLPPFSPIIPVALLPSMALVLLTATFALTFYFSTLPKHTLPVWETVVALGASALGGFGVVALFCSVGVYL